MVWCMRYFDLNIDNRYIEIFCVNKVLCEYVDF